MNATDLAGYLMQYGPLLAQKSDETLRPLHVPGRDPVRLPKLLRQPFPAQAETIMAGVACLKREDSLWVVAECGVGKTIIAMATAHTRHAGRPYRALVMCPGTLIEKWERELRATLPGVIVHQVSGYRDVIHLDRNQEPAGAEWFIVSEPMAKLGSAWVPAYMKRSKMSKEQGIRCPKCGGKLVDAKDNLIGESVLEKSRKFCRRVIVLEKGEDGKMHAVVQKGCGEALWQSIPKPRRYAPAEFIQKHLKNYFDVFVLDEAHEEKGQDSARGSAVGKLASACKKTILLTGTLIGGYADHIRPLMFRVAPKALIQEGLGWSDSMKFSERYGRIETTVIDSGKGGGGEDEDNKQSRGKSSSRRTIKKIKPGIVPTLFGRHLLSKAVFLSLNDLADNLPALDSEIVPVRMDAVMAAEYKKIEDTLGDRLKQMCRMGDKRLLGAFLQTLLAYPDLPFGWNAVGYHDNGSFVPVVRPKNLPEETVRAKEKALVEYVKAEAKRGRKCWVYVQFTDTRDVQTRIVKLLEDAGLRIGSLRAKIDPAKREAWIAKNAPTCDVIVSFPKLVEVGLDFFDAAGQYNVATILFYETGYNLFTLRQASARAWRIGQTKPCKVAYFYYEDTMQERAMHLMGLKLRASQALEGKFTTEGLVAMGGEDDDAMALANTLFQKLDKGVVARNWAKVQLENGTEGPDDDGPAGMDGPSLIALMKEYRVLVPALAKKAGVPAKAVTAARKKGLDGFTARRWERLIAELAAAQPEKVRRVGTKRLAAKSPRGPK